MPYAVYLVSAILFGAVIGSYLNSVIYRLPQRGKTFDPRSICPSCGARIPAYLNLPILSWLILRGKTKCCQKPLSIRYPLVEILTTLLFLGIAVLRPGHFPLVTEFAHPIEGATYLAFAFHGFLLANLVANTFIDIDHKILPDRLTFSLMIVGVVAALVLPEMMPMQMMDFGRRVPPAAQSLISSVVGLGVGYGLTWAVRHGANIVFAAEAMGRGDVKLMGGIGAFLGWQGALLSFFLGCLAGAVGGSVSRLITKNPRVAFGPYLALGAVVTLFFHETIIHFFTVTWPRWQRENASSPAVMISIVVVSSVLLVVLVRRGRSK